MFFSLAETNDRVIKINIMTLIFVLFSIVMRGSRKFSHGGGGGGGGRGGEVQIPRRGLTEIFNMAKINNLAIPGGGGGPDPLPPPLDPPMIVL